MKKSSTVNTVNEGLVMDLNPVVTPNNVLTNCLNGTLVTFNGNENVLQNDMGNGRVETAYLPEGYIPLGTTQLGGIVYVVSYNPLKDKCQIGSFPSPERNITSDEYPEGGAIDCKAFYDGNKEYKGYPFIKSPNQKLVLTKNTTLYPGDKFQIASSEITNNVKYISAFNQRDRNPDLLPKYLKFNVISINDTGKITNLNDTLVWQPVSYKEEEKDKTGEYYIRTDKINSDKTHNLTEYRNLVSSNYNVFQTKTSGKLGVIAELECIDSFSIAWDAVKDESNENWKIYLYTNWTYDNDSSKDKINLYGVYYTYNKGDKEEEGLLQVKNYPTSNGLTDTDILKKENITFYTPPYRKSIDEKLMYKSTEARHNDGTDNQFMLEDPISIQAPSENVTSEPITITLMPVMPFGILEWMKQGITIDLAKLGTGSIDLIQYKYYVEEETFQLNWGLDAYPERNKSITEVSFNFYPLTEDLIQSINKSDIDNRRWKGGKWQTNTSGKWEDSEDSSSLSLGNSAYTISNTGKSSYSGNFVEFCNRENLTENYVYLVEIDITYDTQHIKYYRIFYNSKLFNDQFNTYEDFKDINLQNVLNITYNLEVKTDVTKESTELEEQIPLVLDTQKQDFNTHYIINHYQGTSTGIVSAKTDDSFSVNIKELTDITSNSAFSNDAKATQISNSVLPTTGTPGDIEVSSTSNSPTLDGDTIILPFEFTTKIPLQVNYATNTPLNISYELVHATCTYLWMIYRGRDRYHHLSLYTNITTIGTDDSYVARDQWGDDTRKSGTMSSTYVNCYNYLSQLLDKYDIVALPLMAVWGTDGKGTQDVRIGFNDDNSINITKEYTWNQNLWNQKCGILYAMKHIDGSVIVFSFDGRGPSRFSTISLTKATSLYCLRASSAYNMNNIVSKEYTDDQIPEYIQPLKGYYIPQEYSGTASKYQWTTLRYYPSFSETVTNKLSGNSKMALIINTNVELDPKLNINNLHYTEEGKFQSSYNIIWEIPTSNLLTIFTEFKSDMQVMMPDGTPNKNITVGKSNVYDYEGNKISVIANWEAGPNIPIISKQKKTSKSMQLCVDNGHLRIKSELVDSKNHGTIMGRSEEQNIKITNIPIIPYVS